MWWCPLTLPSRLPLRYAPIMSQIIDQCAITVFNYDRFVLEKCYEANLKFRTLKDT